MKPCWRRAFTAAAAWMAQPCQQCRQSYVVLQCPAELPPPAADCPAPIAKKRNASLLQPVFCQPVGLKPLCGGRAHHGPGHALRPLAGALHGFCSPLSQDCASEEISSSKLRHGALYSATSTGPAAWGGNWSLGGGFRPRPWLLAISATPPPRVGKPLTRA